VAVDYNRGALPREQRIVTALKVEFSRLGSRVAAVTQDISRNGCFLRTDEFLPVGNIIELTIHFGPTSSLSIISRVAHILSERGARTLGRASGMGFEFLEQDEPHRQRLFAFLEDLIDELTPPPRDLTGHVRVIVADPSPRLLERLSTALGDAGFEVVTATNGAEAYASCLDRPPDVVLAADEMPVMDGWNLIKMLAGKPRLATVPVAIMSDDPSDITRLRAYRMGVKDFMQRPFTDEEITIRLRLLAEHARSSNADRSGLRGSLAEIGIATLLSLLEYERKSGILVLFAEKAVARLFVAAGRVVKVESDAGRDARARFMAVLDWSHGNFDFSACEVLGSDEVNLSTQYALLEHARLRDEREEQAELDLEEKTVREEVLEVTERGEREP
jgi:DNA-binding response OmpR family regulator